jgi:hypothetical protein
MARIETLTAALLLSIVAACGTSGALDESATDPVDQPEADTGDDGSDGGEDTPTTPPSQPPPPTTTTTTTPPGQTPPPSVTCSYGPDIYTPYPGTSVYPIGRVAEFPWRGTGSMYPDGVEDFRNYSSGNMIECGSNKDQRNYLDVTAGCLSSAGSGTAASGAVGLTDTGIYRSFALGHTGTDTRPVKWTDQGVEYSFFYQTGATGNVGFKAFTRYTTEYDLYVASWRLDGVVQIQKKQCGTYTVLKKTTTIAPPTPNEWHTIRFEAVGTELRLYLDGALAMTVTDSTFTSGTAGIRIDQMKDALIDNWSVFAP